MIDLGACQENTCWLVLPHLTIKRKQDSNINPAQIFAGICTTGHNSGILILLLYEILILLCENFNRSNQVIHTEVFWLQHVQMTTLLTEVLLLYNKLTKCFVDEQNSRFHMKKGRRSSRSTQPFTFWRKQKAVNGDSGGGGLDWVVSLWTLLSTSLLVALTATVMSSKARWSVQQQCGCNLLLIPLGETRPVILKKQDRRCNNIRVGLSVLHLPKVKLRSVQGTCSYCHHTFLPITLLVNLTAVVVSAPVPDAPTSLLLWLLPHQTDQLWGNKEGVCMIRFPEWGELDGPVPLLFFSKLGRCARTVAYILIPFV